MDTKNLRENYHKLIEHMENASYNKEYICKLKREIMLILQLADSCAVSCYSDIYQRYNSENRSSNVLHAKNTFIRAIEQFDLFGLYPDGTIKKDYLKKGAYHQLCNQYKVIVDCFTEIATKEGQRTSLIYNQSSTFSKFLLTLQQLGVMRLEDATEKDILEVFAKTENGGKMANSTKKKIALALKKCISTHSICEKVLEFLPIYRIRRKNIQYFTKEEIVKIKKVLSAKDPILSARDKAIGTIALYTGLRRSDITGLVMDAIDWENEIVRIRQQKTGTPLTVRLTTAVGNAIYDYIQNERPETDCEYIFISLKKPYGRIKSTSKICVHIMEAAGIRQNLGDSKGLHLFRHHFATKLLENGISRPVICNLAGLTHPNSLEAYLSADFKHLKLNAISVEHFPIAQEVFDR